MNKGISPFELSMHTVCVSRFYIVHYTGTELYAYNVSMDNGIPLNVLSTCWIYIYVKCLYAKLTHIFKQEHQ